MTSEEGGSVTEPSRCPTAMSGPPSSQRGQVSERLGQQLESLVTVQMVLTMLHPSIAEQNVWQRKFLTNDRSATFHQLWCHRTGALVMLEQRLGRRMPLGPASH